MNRFADLVEEKPVNRFADLLNEVPPMDLTQLEQIEYGLPQQRQIADPQSRTTPVAMMPTPQTNMFNAPTIQPRRSMSRVDIASVNAMTRLGIEPEVASRIADRVMLFSEKDRGDFADILQTGNSSVIQKAIDKAVLTEADSRKNVFSGLLAEAKKPKRQYTPKPDPMSPQEFSTLKQAHRVGLTSLQSIPYHQLPQAEQGTLSQWDIPLSDRARDAIANIGKGIEYSALKFAQGAAPVDLLVAGVNQQSPQGTKVGNTEEVFQRGLDYQPGMIGKTAGGIAKTIGMLTPSGALLKGAKGAKWLTQAAKWGLGSSIQEVYKGIAEKIDPEHDYEYKGAVGVAEDTALGAAFGLIDAIPAKGAIGGIAKTGASSAMMSGITAASGGSTEDIIVSAALPFAFKGIDLVKKTPNAIKTKLNERQTKTMVSEYRKEAAKKGLDLDAVPDEAIANVIGNLRNARWWKSQVESGRISAEEYRQGLNNIRVATDPLIQAIARASKRTEPAKTQQPAGLPQGRTVRTDNVGDVMNALPEQGYVKPARQSVKPDTSIPARGKFVRTADGIMFPDGRKIVTPMTPETEAATKDRGYIRNVEKAAMDYANGTKGAQAKLKQLLDKRPEFKTQAENAYYDGLLERANSGDSKAVDKLNSLVQRTNLPSYDELLERAQAGDQQAVEAIQSGQYRNESRPAGQPYRRPTKQEIKQQEAEQTISQQVFGREPEPIQEIPNEQMQRQAEAPQVAVPPTEVTGSAPVTAGAVPPSQTGPEYDSEGIAIIGPAGDILSLLKERGDLPIDSGSIRTSLKMQGKEYAIPQINTALKYLQDEGLTKIYNNRRVLTGPSQGMKTIDVIGEIKKRGYTTEQLEQAYSNWSKKNASDKSGLPKASQQVLEAMDRDVFFRELLDGRQDAVSAITPPQQPIGEGQGGWMQEREDVTTRIIRQTKEVNDKYASLIGTQYTTDYGAKYQITGFNDLGVAYGKRIVDGKPKGKEVVVRGFDPSVQVAQDVQGKEPWEMARGEFAKTPKAKELFGGKRTSIYSGLGNPSRSAQRRAFEQSISGYHKLDVKEAVKRGDKVPLPVLQEYSSEPWAQEAIKKLDTPTPSVDNTPMSKDLSGLSGKQREQVEYWLTQKGPTELYRDKKGNILLAEQTDVGLFQSTIDTDGNYESIGHEPVDTKRWTPIPDSATMPPMSKDTAARDIAPQTTASTPLYHTTKRENLESIAREGIKGTGEKPAYLSPDEGMAEKWKSVKGDTILRIRPEGLALSDSYEGMRKSEANIPPSMIEVKTPEGWQRLSSIEFDLPKLDTELGQKRYPVKTDQGLFYVERMPRQGWKGGEDIRLIDNTGQNVVRKSKTGTNTGIQFKSKTQKGLIEEARNFIAKTFTSSFSPPAAKEGGKSTPEKSDRPAELTEAEQQANKSIDKTWMKDYRPFTDYSGLTDQQLADLRKDLPKRTNDMTEAQKKLSASVYYEQIKRHHATKIGERAVTVGKYAEFEKSGKWPNGTPFPKNGDAVETVIPGIFGMPTNIKGTVSRQKNGLWTVKIDPGQNTGGATKTPLTPGWQAVRTADAPTPVIPSEKYSVYPITVGGKDVFAVRTNMGNARGFGDAIFDTETQAKEYADRIKEVDASNKKSREVARQEQEQKDLAAQEKERKVAERRSRSPIVIDDERLASIDPKQAGRIKAALAKTYRFEDKNIGVASMREAIESGHYVRKEAVEVPAIEYNRTKFNRMDYEQQKAYEKRLQEKKTEYRLYTADGTSIGIPKMVFDVIKANKPTATDAPATKYETDSLPKPLADGAENRRREILQARLDRGEAAPAKALREFEGEAWADEAIAKSQERPAYGTPEHKEYISKAVEKYDSDHSETGIINADTARRTLAGYDPADIANEAKYFGDAAEIADRVFDKWLMDKKGAGDDTVLFTAGGTGSGKSTAAQNMKDRPVITMDTTLSSRDYAESLIDKAIKAGFTPEILYVYRDPVDAWENGVWPRWEAEGGHFVSADNHLNTHRDARETVLALAKKYGNRINIVIKENKSGKSPSTLSLAQLKNKPYNEAELREKINAISKEKVKANRSLEGREEVFAGQGRTASTGEGVNPVSQPQEVAAQIKQAAPKVTDTEYNPPRDMYDNPTAEQVEAMQRALAEAKKLPIAVSPKDLNAKKIHDAFRNTSWTPDQKPSLYQREYINDMVKTYESLSKLAKSERQKAVLAEEMEAYRKGYIEKLNTFLDSHSRVASSAITGPAKFPTRANQKRGDAADKRRDEWIEWDKRATKAIEKKINDIAVDEAGGQIGMLEKKIAAAEKLQQAMRDANKIVRSKTLSDSQKIEQIEAMGIKGAGELLKPDYMGRVGFADFEMTNNLAGIKRMKARLEDLKAREAATGEDFVMEARGVKVVDNKDAERVQIVFDTKPDADTIQKLKRRGFRWSPSNNAWQRKNTAQGIKDARQIVESLQGPKSSGGPTPNRKEAGFVRIPQAEDVTRSAKEAKQAVVTISRKLARKTGLKRKIKDFARDPLSIPKDVGDGVLYATAPVDFELEKISPKLSQGIRDHAYDVVDGTQENMNKVISLFEAEGKMTAEDMGMFEDAWFKADFETLEKLGKKYDFDAKAVQDLLDTYYDREIEVGINTRYRNNFLPQRVRDMDGLVKFLTGKENRDVIEDFITKFREKNKRRPTEREIIDGVNSMMQGYPASGVRIYQPGISKTRKIPYVYKEIRDFYYTPFEALRYYIENAEEAIATRKFFGKVSKEYGKLRKAEARYRQKAETLAAQGDTEGADNAWNTAESIVREIRERGYAMTADDVIDDNSVGSMLAEMFDSGELKRGDSKKVQGLLQAYFNSKRANKFARTWLSLNYLTKLGNSMLHNVTQLSEIGNPLAEDFRTAIQESLKALVNAGEINKYNAPYIRHIGDEIGEFSVDNLTGFFLQLTMWVDRPLKFATVNTAINKARREAQRKAVAAPFVDRLKTYFGDDWQNALNDLRSGELTDRVKRYGYYRLSDVQPVTRAQSSQAALNSPGMIKPLLQMKNFSLRQIYRIVNDARREIKAGRVKRGIGIFLGTAALLLSLQAGTDVIKDLIRGRKLKSAQEYFVDRTLNNLFTSRYDLASLEYSNPSDVIAKSLAPSIPIVDDVFFAWRKDSAYPLYRMVPLVGQKMADIAMPDSQKLKSAYPEPDEWKSDQYKGIYRALDSDNIEKAQKYYAELKKKGIDNSDILQSIKSRSAVRVPEKDREQWLAGLSKKYRAMYEREMERQKSLEVKFYGLLSDSDLRKELAKSMTTPTQNNGWVQRARKGQEEKVKMLMAELKRRKESG